MSSSVLNPGERWYAVRTLPGREMRACLQLENQNFTHFCHGAEDYSPRAQIHDGFGGVLSPISLCCA
jgi:hypothetical protein